MLVSKANRREIYTRLFNDGVLVAEKNFFAKSHEELKGVRNIEVIKACQSLRSRGYVKEQFSWQHYYYFLTDEGIEYLRGWLHLPPDVVPKTLQAKAIEPARLGAFRGERGGRRFGDGGKFGGRGPGDRSAPGGFRPEFGGMSGRGFGRGPRPEGGPRGFGAGAPPPPPPQP